MHQISSLNLRQKEINDDVCGTFNTSSQTKYKIAMFKSS